MHARQAPHAPGCARLEWRRYSTARSPVCICAERVRSSPVERLFPSPTGASKQNTRLLTAACKSPDPSSPDAVSPDPMPPRPWCGTSSGWPLRGRQQRCSARAGASESHSSAAHAAHDPHHHCTRDVARSRCSRRQDCALVPVLRTGVQSRAKIGISAPCQGLQVEHRRQIRHA